MATSTVASDLVDLARHAVRSLESCNRPSIWEGTRAETVAGLRTLLARQLAEDTTGVSYPQARLTSLYSRSQLSDAQVEASKSFAAAYASALADLPADFAGLLQRCRVMAGIDYAPRRIGPAPELARVG